MTASEIKEIEEVFWTEFAKLTPKQQIFFREYVIKGVTQVEAYKLAYDTSNMKDCTIASNASRGQTIASL